MTNPSEIEMYFFGCWRAAGHFWIDPTHPERFNTRSIEAKLPKELSHGGIDASFCPGAIKGLLYRRSRPEVEGEAAIHHIGGWTILAWWDRSLDDRGGCNSNVVALGVHDYPTMISIAIAQIPHVIDRQRQPMRLVTDDVAPIRRSET